VRANLDEKAKSDPRVRRLARVMGWHVDWVLGALACGPWMAALNRTNDDNPEGLISEDDAEDSTDHRELIGKAIACGMAERREGGLLYFAGMAERGKWLLTKQHAASLGGQARAAGAARVGGRFTSQASRHQPAAGESPATPPAPHQAETSPPDLAPDLAPDLPLPLALALSPAPDQGLAPRARKPRKRAPAPEPIGMRVVTDAFQESYLARAGRKPSWEDGRLLGRLARLVAAHGPDEVCRSIDVLFTAPPTFLAGSMPDLATLVQHFDKLATPARAPLTSRSGLPALSPSELAAEAQRDMADERKAGKR
jgi:hypothetical protein